MGTPFSQPTSPEPAKSAPLPEQPAPAAFQLWSDKTLLSFIGITAVSREHDMILGWKFTAKVDNAVEWMNGEAVILRLSQFAAPRYEFIMLAQNRELYEARISTVFKPDR
jgi:hypothetical protein